MKKKYLVISLLISFILSTPSFADSPALTFDYQKPYSTDIFKVKVYKKKMKNKTCQSYLSFDIKRKIGKGKKDPINETAQNLTLYFSFIDPKDPQQIGSLFARFNFKWGNYKNNIGYRRIDGCSGKITKEDVAKPIIIWLADSNSEGIYPTFILN